MAPARPDTPREPESILTIGEWTVYPLRNQIEASGRLKRLEPKVMQVLVRLAAARGAPVSRQELLDEVWGDVVVIDRVINRSIWELRRSLGDDPKAPRYVETIPKRGYRLVAEVAPVLSEATEKTSPRPGAVWALTLLVIGMVGLALLTRRPEAKRSGPPFLPGAIRPVTTSAGWDYDVRISPDGETLAYVAATPETGSWDLYLVDRATGERSLLSAEPGAEGHPAWSPDSRRVAYYRYLRTGTELLVREVDEPRKESTLGSIAADYPELDWSPDGGSIAYRQRLALEGPSAIFARSFDDSLVRQLTRPPTSWRGDGFPRYSPDGRWLAFIRSRVEGVSDLYLASLAEGAEYRLTHDAAPMSGLDWDLEGRLTFASRRAGAREMWTAELVLAPRDGPPTLGPLQPLSLTGYQPGSPSASPDALAFVSWGGDTNLWRVEADPAATSPVSDREIVSSTSWDFHPALSPDQSRLAFASNRSGHYEIWLRELTSGATRQLTHFEGPFTGTPRWSGDGGSLVFDSRPEGHADLFVVDLATDEVSRLGQGMADDLWGSWGPAGELYFASNRTGQWQVWRRDPRGGEEQVTRSGGFAPQVGPGGRCLYYVRPHVRQLWRQPIQAGCEEALLVDEIGEAEAGSWWVTRRGVFVIRRGKARGEPDQVVIHPASGDAPRRIWEAELNIPWYDPAITAPADGSFFLLGVEARPESDIYLASNAPNEPRSH